MLAHMSDHNPYAPPSADVRDVSLTVSAMGEQFNPDGHNCPASSGWHWYGAAWRIFKARPLAWWAVLILAFGVFWVGSFIPLGGLLVSVLMPVLMAGVGSCVRSQLQSGRFEIGQVFDGFRQRTGPLLQAGLIYLLMGALGMGFMSLFSSTSVSAVYVGSMAERQAAMRALFSGGGIAMWGYFIFMSVAMSAILFAPYLIHEHSMSPQQAMVASFKACFKNVPATLVWMLGYVVWAIAASIPVFLGWLILLPVLCLTVYVAYRDIFYA